MAASGDGAPLRKTARHPGHSYHQLPVPSEAELQVLLERLAERIGRALARQGVLVRDAENSLLEFAPAADGPMADLLGHSITYRVAMGPRAGQKVFSLQTVPAQEDAVRKGVAQYAGFSLHAGLGVEADQREQLERLVRYVSRPPVAVALQNAASVAGFPLTTEVKVAEVPKEEHEHPPMPGGGMGGMDM